MLANLIDSLDLPPHSRVAVQTEKSVEALMLYLAVLRAGHVYLPLNMAYQAGEVSYFIGNAEPAVVVCAGRSFGWVSQIAFAAGTRHVFTLDDDRSGTLLERAAYHPDQHTPALRKAGDLAAILYTSGTTGRSKGAMLTHGNLLSNAQVLNSYWGWQPGDVLLHALPIFHVHGLFVASHGAAAQRQQDDLVCPLRCSTRWWRGCPRPRCSWACPRCTCACWANQGFTRDACRRMRLFISGSAPLLIETFNDFRQRTGHTILERYGMSETVMLTSNPYRPESARRGGTVGLPLPGVGVRVHSDAGAAHAQRRDRRHRGQGPQRLQGLLAHAREDGRRVHHRPVVQDRRRGAHRRRRLSHHRRPQQGSDHQRRLQRLPGRSRSCAQRMPGVAESAVVGVPHPDFGEAVVAVVVPKPGAALEEAAVIGAMKSRIANFKVPKRVFVRDRVAAQRDGQGAEEPAARTAFCAATATGQHQCGRQAGARPDTPAATRPRDRLLRVPFGHGGQSRGFRLSSAATHSGTPRDSEGGWGRSRWAG
jgi:malonyl-CoA/methylmalonyl-CoA synthetase